MSPPSKGRPEPEWQRRKRRSSWQTYSKQGELGVWLVLVVNGREALETHSFEVVLEFIERPADRTLQEVERQHRADLLAAAPREYEESKRFLENMRSKSGSFENM